MVVRNGDSGDSSAPCQFCIRLTFAPVGRQRSAVLWLSHAMECLGGSYLGDGRFSFASERQRRIALKVLSESFGASFFEPVDSGGPANCMGG